MLVPLRISLSTCVLKVSCDHHSLRGDRYLVLDDGTHVEAEHLAEARDT